MIRGGHPGTLHADGPGGEFVDRVVPGWRKKELRGTICEFNEVPTVRDQRERDRLVS